MHYDIIITGTGCAGYSLVYYLLNSSLRNKRILIIDQEDNKSANKTWCYWSKEPLEIHPPHALFSWKKIEVDSSDNFVKKEMKDLNYFHLKSQDFFGYIDEFITDFPNVHKLNDKVSKINFLNNTSKEVCEVVTKNNGVITSDWVFNSVLELIDSEPRQSIKQLFTGWTIKTKQPYFKVDTAQLMKFNHLDQNEVNFIYILPFSDNEALIEYTLFSNQDMVIENLEKQLELYIKSHLKIDEYSILSKEIGKIPMSNQFRKNQNSSRIINIGTAGGCTKASTGYTFYNIQKQTKDIVSTLENNIDFSNYLVLNSKRFIFYDNIILNIIQKWPQEASKIFNSMFKNNKPEIVFKFLNEETNILEELNILRKLPLWVCIKSLLNYEKY
jgi:lycopene beta-cyclase